MLSRGLLFSVKYGTSPLKTTTGACIHGTLGGRYGKACTTGGWRGTVGLARNVLAIQIHVQLSDSGDTRHNPALLPYKAMCRAAAVSPPTPRTVATRRQPAVLPPLVNNEAPKCMQSFLTCVLRARKIIVEGKKPRQQNTCYGNGIWWLQLQLLVKCH